MRDKQFEARYSSSRTACEGVRDFKVRLTPVGPPSRPRIHY
jgi:hypothetical protein